MVAVTVLVGPLITDTAVLPPLATQTVPASATPAPPTGWLPTGIVAVTAGGAAAGAAAAGPADASTAPAVSPAAASTHAATAASLLPGGRHRPPAVLNTLMFLLSFPGDRRHGSPAPGRGRRAPCRRVYR